jgi:catecholate siderophore receptor
MTATQTKDGCACGRLFRTQHIEIGVNDKGYWLSRYRLCLLFTVLIARPLLAQHSSTLTGRVLDSASLPIAGAEVTATQTSGKAEQSAVSNQNGEFSIKLEPGDYTVQITKTAFRPAVRTVHVGSTASHLNDIVLPLAPLQNTVQVTDDSNYLTTETSSSTRTLTPLLDVPQTVNTVTDQQVQDQLMLSLGDVVRYVPGVSAHQGENNRDEIVIRGTDSSSSFFVNGMRDDVQYYRDLYNVERTEILKGPNALSFGRGGGGGVINRVTKEAGFTPLRQVVLEGGSFNNKRVSADFDQPLSDALAFRLNGVYENSGSFRHGVDLERYGINPTVTFAPSQNTRFVASFENFRDDRTADRGITSYLGRPVDVPVGTYYGNAKNSYARALVNDGSLLFEHQFRHWLIRNRSLFANYDRGYQNYVPGAVNSARTLVTLSAYNNATNRTNLLNQTDFLSTIKTGTIRHNVVAGIDLGRQLTDNFRNTGYFNNTATAMQVPFADPTATLPVTFRQSATDANNHLRTNIAAGYVQNQMDLSRFFQVLAGVRYDHFDLQYHNNRNGQDLRRIDNVVSPRAALLFKPVPMMSLYLSYSVTYLPSSGDQFSSLTDITQQVKPEKFSNYEAGVKWNLRRSLFLTTAVYRLDRTNTRSLDPNDPTRIVQTGSQRTNGYEAELTGKLTGFWTLTGGYAYQDAFVTRATTAAAAGAQVAQAPHHMFSLWNQYRVLPRLSAGVGLLNRSQMFATIDNSVIIPSYFRADAALFYSVTERIRLQANVENLFDRRYILNADSNTNLSPGSPRAIRLALVARF